MCSRNDTEDGAESYMEAKSKPLWSSTCQKCGEQHPVIQILQIKHAYCKNCFVTHVNHKFRSTLGKSKMMRPSDVVLAAFSGSLKSHAMLHLLHTGLSEKSHKRFLFKVQFIYVDEGAVLGLSLPERTANLRAIAKLAEQYGFSGHFTSLACLYNANGPRCFPLNKNSTLTIDNSLEQDLQLLFQNISNLTAKEDLLKQLRKQLLLLAAKELCCGKVFMAPTSTDLAVQILTDVSIGRGSHMHHDVTFCDVRDKDVKIMRPLLDLSSKEVAFYSVYHKLDNVFIPSLCTKTASDSSIHNLSKQFVMDLMENFPSTVSTVFRTGEKLGSTSSPNNSEEEENFCVLCQDRLQVNLASCTSAQATQFSRLISSLGPLGFDSKTLSSVSGSKSGCENSLDHGCCSSVANSHCHCNSNQDKPHLSDIMEFCCYGCRLILHDVKTLSGIPERILEQVQRRKSLNSMRDCIKDFLL